MAVLATRLATDAGTAPTLFAASAGDTVEIGSGTDSVLVVKNTGTGPKQVIITPVRQTSYGVALPVKSVTIAATTGEVWIPLRTDYVNADGLGRATLTVTGGDLYTGVSWAAVRLS